MSTKIHFVGKSLQEFFTCSIDEFSFDVSSKGLSPLLKSDDVQVSRQPRAGKAESESTKLAGEENSSANHNKLSLLKFAKYSKCNNFSTKNRLFSYVTIKIVGYYVDFVKIPDT